MVGKEKDGLPLSVKKAVRGDTYAGLFSTFATGSCLLSVLFSVVGVVETGGKVKDGFPSSVKKAVDGVASSDCFVAFSSATGLSLGVSVGRS
jgi:hypothetical protein